MNYTIYDTLFKFFCKKDAIEDTTLPKPAIKELEDLDKKEKPLAEELLAEDLETVEALKSQMFVEGGVVVYLGDGFSNSWLIKKPEDYPLVKIEALKESTRDNWEKECLSEDNPFVVSTTLSGFRQSFATMEGASLFLKEFYRIRTEMLEAIFPKV